MEGEEGVGERVMLPGVVREVMGGVGADWADARSGAAEDEIGGAKIGAEKRVLGSVAGGEKGLDGESDGVVMVREVPAAIGVITRVIGGRGAEGGPCGEDSVDGAL